MAVYCICRALYQLAKAGMRAGHLPRVRHLAVWLFGVANAPIMFAFLLQPKLLDVVRESSLPSECAFTHLDLRIGVLHAVA